MHACPLLRASIDAHNAARRRRTSSPHARTRVRGGLSISAICAERLGWRALRDVLDAIPDSNDDFGLF